MQTDFRYRDIPDWPALRQRYVAFLNRESSPRSFIAHIQNPNAARPPAPEAWMLSPTAEDYQDPRRLFNLKSWRKTAWNWHADLFQYRTPSYGPNVFTGFAGGKPMFGSDTVWHAPVISGLDEADRVHFDEDNPFWRRHTETLDYFSEACAGVEHLGMTDFGGATDWISTLMPTETFLIETLERPDEMRAFALRLAGEMNRAFDLAYRRVSRRTDGVVNWMPVWSEGRLGTVQDDMAIHFSPELYADVFLPAVRAIAGHTEHTVLHWHDGCRRHLDALLRIEALDVVQYGHDPNSPPYTSLVGDMRRIQAAGRKLFIGCVEAGDAQFFIEHLDPRGLLMIIDTESDAASRVMEANVRRWVEDRLDHVAAAPAPQAGSYSHFGREKATDLPCFVEASQSKRPRLRNDV